MAKILIADQHPLFLHGLRSLLRTHVDDLQLIQANSLDAVLACLHCHRDITLLLLDVNMSDCGSVAELSRVCRDFPQLPFVLLSARQSVDLVAQAKAVGAAGFISKSASTDTLVQAVLGVLAGQGYWPAQMQQQLALSKTGLSQGLAKLTPKQFEVLSCLQEGKMNKQIAYEMNVTEATIKAHISAILRKLQVKTRTQAVLLLEK